MPKEPEQEQKVKEDKIVAVSGGFDPVHIGHLRMFREARKLGGRLVVILNNDNWLRAKKGYSFMGEDERAEIISEMRCVDDVIITGHENDCKDMSVCEVLENLMPDIFANGGDRKADNIPEYELCERLGIEMAFNVGGEKARSSSELVEKASRGKENKK